MPTAAWIVYDVIVAVLGYIALDRILTFREKCVVAVVIVCGLGVAAYSGYSDYSDHHDNAELRQQVNEMQRTQTYNTGQLNALKTIDGENSGLLATVAHNQSLLLADSRNTVDNLKSHALELASTLMQRSSTILTLAAQHSIAFPSLPAQQQEAQRVEIAHKQALHDSAQLLNDYKNNYANQVLDFRQKFMAQGQKNWARPQDYLNPSNAFDIARIGGELFEHANQLN